MVEIKLYEDKPVILAGLAAKISQSSFRKSIEELYQECKEKQDEIEKLLNKITKGYRHLIFGDFVGHAIAFKNLSRLAAIYLWRNVNTLNEVYGAGIEASFRVIKPEKFVFNDTLFDQAKKLYNLALEKGVKEQDARYVLPEATLTRLIFSSPPRYYAKLSKIFKRVKLDEFQEIGKSLENIVREEFKFDVFEDVPTEWEFYGKWQEEKGKEKSKEENFNLSFIDNDKNSLSLTAYVSGSMAMFAQLVRQRQFCCVIEPLSSIVENAEFVLPSSFDSELREKYMDLAKRFNEKQRKLVEKKDDNFAYYILLGQKARAKVEGKGYGIIGASKARSCGVAQWEIRNEFGLPLLKELIKHGISPKQAAPSCIREGVCREPATFKKKKGFCKVFNDYVEGKIKFKDMAVDYLINALKENYESFKV